MRVYFNLNQIYIHIKHYSFHTIGLDEFVVINYGLMTMLQQSGNNEDTCNKDTGEKKTIRKWSRGHCFIVSGGHISM